MLLSSSLRLSPRLAVSVSAAMAFSTSSSNGKIYELRTYNIIPEKVPTFIQLTNAHLHLRTAHSTLLGYWTCELGALNEVIHLWEYDNYAHRASVRKALSQDKEWLETYVKEAFPCIDKQSNVTLSLLPWTPFNGGSGDGTQPRAFQLIRRSFLPNRFPQWEHQIRQGWAARLHYSQPIGFWKTVFGPSDNVYELWAYESFDEAVAVDERVRSDEEWTDTVGQAILFTKETYVKGLLPIDISPLK